jgi:hypothetical protein
MNLLNTKLQFTTYYTWIIVDTWNPPWSFDNFNNPSFNPNFLFPYNKTNIKPTLDSNQLVQTNKEIW